MNRSISLFSVMISLFFVSSSCGPAPSPTAIPPTPEFTAQWATAVPVLKTVHAPAQPTAPLPTESPTPSPLTTWPPTPTALPPGRTLVVNSFADSGAGTLRQAIMDAQPGDIITFDPAIFPPEAPATIYLTSYLPTIDQGHITIDGSNAGVIVDGSNIGDEWGEGIDIMSSGNIIRGLRLENFLPGAGIVIAGDGQFNTIGGDRSIGAGPLGQGNQVILSGTGIGIWGKDTFYNTVTGNLVGTDASGNPGLGNNIAIVVRDGASYNILGPDNIIAFNNNYGIQVLHSNSIGNTITRNSVHDNLWRGISHKEGGNTELVWPFILDFNLPNGTIAGFSCPGCVVEIFSERGYQGEVYEGHIKADASGAFTFNKEAGFAGPSLTTTATDPYGNTSEFSDPTTGTSNTSTIFTNPTDIQQGNPLPKYSIQTSSSPQLADNRIGHMGPIFDWNADICVDNTKEYGFKWRQISFDVFDWSEVVSGMGGYSTNVISPEQDRAVTLLAQDGVKMMYIMVYWDEALGMPTRGHPRFASQQEIDRYLDHVRFLVRNLKGRVEYFEMFNEPNYSDDNQSQQNIRVSDYIELVRQTIPVIRAEYPQAKITVGATGLNEDWRPYLFAILESDVMPLVDAVTWHSGAMYSPAYPETREYYYAYPSIVQQIKDTAAAHGFSGEYINAELHSQHHSENWLCDPCYPWTHSYVEGAKYLARGIVMNLGMDIAVGLSDPLEGAPKSRVVRNLATLMAGALPIDIEVDIQSEAVDILNYGFSLPNGDLLLALWTNGVAVNADPGVNTTLTFQDLSFQRVMGIDVLNGYEQELVTENGGLVIRNLLVKDYPIILRLVH